MKALSPESVVIPVKNGNYIGQTYQYTSINPSTTNRAQATGSGIFSMANYAIAIKTGKWAIEPGVEGDDLSTLLCNYDFGESTCYSGSGTNVTDGTFSGRSGTLINTPVYSTSNGGTMNFSTNKYMTVASDANLALGTSNYTIECWVNFNSFGTIAPLINATTSTNSAASNLWWLGYYLGTITLGQHTTGTRTYYTVALSTNTWYHIGVSRISGQSWFFIDGNYMAESATTNPNIFSSTNWGQVGLGIGIVATPYYLDGTLAAVRIYKNKYLNDAEIRRNYYMNRGRFI